MKRRILLVFAALLLLGGGFVWGFLAKKDGIFPFNLLRYVARQVRLEDAGRVNVSTNAANVKALTSLPYVSGTFDPNSAARGVLFHDPDRAQQGVMFYTDRRNGTARLIDMDGKLVYEWKFPAPKFDHADLFPNGDVIAVREMEELVKIDNGSNVLWSLDDEVHHNFWVEDTGRIQVLVRRERLIPEIHPTINSLDDEILTLSAEGEKLGEFSLIDAMLASPYAFTLASVSHRGFEEPAAEMGRIGLDVLHCNHVQVLDGRLAAISDIFAKGNLLVSMRNINALVILNGETKEVVWMWGPGNLTLQHHPVPLENGHMLVFNNGLEYSQILELDPLARQITWLYEDRDEFFSKTRGSNQRLANGNTLITESDTGYAFQVTPEGEIVWEFANPDVDKEGVRTSFWRMVLFSWEQLPFLDR